MGGWAIRVVFALALTLPLVWTACGEEGPPEEVSVTRDLQEMAQATGPQPGTGKARVGYANGRVSIHSNGAPRLRILQHVSRLAGFELVATEALAGPLVLKIDNVPLMEALQKLLAELPYGLAYEFDPRTDALSLVRVRVGVPDAVVAAAAGGAPDAPGDPAADREQRLRNLKERSSERWRERRRTQAERDRVLSDLQDAEIELYEQLLDPDPGVRRTAASDVSTQGDGLWRVIGVLEEDPDPAVRATAAERLGEDGSYAAVRSLIASLADPDTAVVLKAIAALEYAGDESVAVELLHLLDHEDPRVREAADEALDSLE